MLPIVQISLDVTSLEEALATAELARRAGGDKSASTAELPDPRRRDGAGA